MEKKTWLTLSLLATMSITGAFAQSNPSLMESLTGSWQFIAANNGVEVAPGIYSSRSDTVTFTATPSADGTYLQCHADCLYKSKDGNEYPADWRIVVEENGEGRHRLGWVLDAEQPAFTKEFTEGRASYLEDGFFYWGGTEGGHRYIYLLAENEDASAIIGMTFWSAWSSEETTEYALSNSEHQSRKMYAVVAESIPYGNSVGWIEIWSSPKVRRSSDPTGITQHLSPNTQHPSVFYDLQGRQLNGQPKRGIYLVNGRKYLLP